MYKLSIYYFFFILFPLLFNEIIDESLNPQTQKQGILRLSQYKQEKGQQYLIEITQLFCQQQQEIYAIELSRQLEKITYYYDDIIAECCKQLLQNLLSFSNEWLASASAFFNNKFPQLFDFIENLFQNIQTQQDCETVFQIVAQCYQFKYAAILNDDLCILLLQMLGATQEKIFQTIQQGQFTKKLTMSLITIVSAALSWEDYPEYFDKNTQSILNLIDAGCKEQSLSIEEQEKILQIIFNLISYHQDDMKRYNCLSRLYEQLFYILNQYQTRPPYIICQILSKLQAFIYSFETQQYLKDNFQNQCIQMALNCLNYVPEVDQQFIYSLCQTIEDSDVTNQAISLLKLLKQHSKEMEDYLTQLLSQQYNYSDISALYLCQIVGTQDQIKKAIQDVINQFQQEQSWQFIQEDKYYFILKQFEQQPEESDSFNQIQQFLQQNQLKIVSNNGLLTLLSAKLSQINQHCQNKLKYFQQFDQIIPGLIKEIQQSNYDNTFLVEGFTILINVVQFNQYIINELQNMFLFVVQNQVGQQVQNSIGKAFCHLALQQTVEIQSQYVLQLLQMIQQCLQQNQEESVSQLNQCITILLNNQNGQQLCQLQELNQYIQTLLTQQNYWQNQGVDRITAIYLLQTYIRITKNQQIGQQFEQLSLNLLQDQQKQYIFVDLLRNINVLLYEKIYFFNNYLQIILIFQQRRNSLLSNKLLLKEVFKFVLNVLVTNYNQIIQQFKIQSILDDFLIPGASTFQFREQKQQYICILSQIYQNNMQQLQQYKVKFIKCFAYLFNKTKLSSFINKKQVNSNLNIQLMDGVIFNSQFQNIQNLEQQVCQLLDIQVLRV